MNLSDEVDNSGTNEDILGSWWGVGGCGLGGGFAGRGKVLGICEAELLDRWGAAGGEGVLDEVALVGGVDGCEGACELRGEEIVALLLGLCWYGD